MKSKEQLLEQYDDLLFTALMERVAEKEGARLMEENAKLRADPSMDIPAESYQRGLQAINRAFAAHARRSGVRVAGRLLRNIAIAVLTVIILASIAFAVSPELRAYVVTTFLNINETYTDISFMETPSSDNLQINLGWIPDGFDLGYEDAIEGDIERQYTNQQGGVFYVEKMEPHLITVDTENASIERVTIQGYEGASIRKGNEVRIVWLNTDIQTVYLVDAENLSFKDTLKIAENFS